MTGLDFARAYIDDLLVISKGSLTDHLENLDEVFTRLEAAGLKINGDKSFFCRDELEYLGYWITRVGVQPVVKKVEGINSLAAPTKRKDLRQFLGLVNYYRDLWPRQSHILAPLTALTSTNDKFKWSQIEQGAFDTMKKVMACTTIRQYPDFNKPFHIYTDARKVQLGAVIVQDDKPITFYSQKLLSLIHI